MVNKVDKRFCEHFTASSRFDSLRPHSLLRSKVLAIIRKTLVLFVAVSLFIFSSAPDLALADSFTWRVHVGAGIITWTSVETTNYNTGYDTFMSGYVDMPFIILSNEYQSALISGATYFVFDYSTLFSLPGVGPVTNAALYVSSSVQDVSLSECSFTAPENIGHSTVAILRNGLGYSIYSPSSSSGNYSRSFALHFDFENLYQSGFYTIAGTIRIGFNVQYKFGSSAYNPNLTQSVSLSVSQYAANRYSVVSSVSADQAFDQSLANQQISSDQAISQAQIANNNANTDRLANGYDDSAVNDVAASQAAQLDSYQGQQDAAFTSSYDKVNVFTDTAFSTATLSGMASSFAFVGVLFNLLWSGFGDFNVILVLMLSIGVAGYILHLRR